MTRFELPDTHVHLAADGGTDLLPSEELWRRSPAELDAALPGWLLASFPIEPGPAGGAEMHPNGDELPHTAGGVIDVVLGAGEPDERTVTLRAGQTCRVPRGTWHRLVGREPGTLVTVTYGRGTQHEKRAV